MIHIFLESISTVGSPVALTHEFLRGYFQPDNLRLENIAFKLKDQGDFEHHATRMQCLVDELAK